MFLKSILVALFFVSMGASATLVNSDLYIQGDNRATYDTVTGLDWLKFNETRAMSINTSLQAFPLWRVPTATELNGLMTTIFGGIPGQNSGLHYFSQESVTLAQTSEWYARLGGGYWGTGGYRYTAGYISDGTLRGFIAKSNNYGRLYLSAVNSNAPTSNTPSYSAFGVFLVANTNTGATYSALNTTRASVTSSPVPSPIGLTMVAFFIFGLLSLKRKNNVKS